MRGAGKFAMVALVAAGLGLVGADSSDGSVPSATFAGIPASSEDVLISEAELEDLAFVANDLGISVEEAIRRYGWHDEFNAFIEVLQGSWPQSFASARITRDGPAAAEVLFRDNVPEDIITLAESLPIDIRLVPGAGFSELEQNEKLIAAYRTAERTAGAADVVGEFDSTSGIIKLAVRWEPDIDQPAAVSALRSAVQNATGLGADSLVITTASESLGGPEAVLYGGSRLEFWGKADLRCSVSFTVHERDGGRRGLLSADHCLGVAMSFENKSGDPEYTVNVLAGTINPDYGDFMWFDAEGSHSNPDDFYHKRGEVPRDVTGTANPAVGSLVFRYGQATDKTWDYVWKRNQCGGGYCRLSAIENDDATDGDSGGPYFYGGTAYGVHYGDIKVSGKVVDAFSVVTFSDDALPRPNSWGGVYVVTS